MIRELINNWELVFTLVKRDLKVRYKASTLGFLWSFGKPLFLMIIMWAVFSQITRAMQTEIPYALHLLTGLLPWLFFQGGLLDAQGSILHNANVVKKVKLPSAAFPAATVLSHLIHLLLAMIILFVFIAFYAAMKSSDLWPSWEIIFLPFVILLQFLMIFGISLILSSLNVFYRDISSISEIALTAWFYLTPVIYSVDLARDHLKSMVDSDILYYLYLANPMTPITIAYRRVLYGRHMDTAPEVSDSTLFLGLGVSIAFTIIVIWIGIVLFNRLSRKFADEL